MKKITATAMILLTVICFFTACKKDDAETVTDDIKVVDISATRYQEETTLPKTNKTVKLKVPSSLIKGQAGGDIEKYAEKYDYKIVEDKDGNVTLKMDGMSYSLLLSNIGMDTMLALGDIVDSGDYPYVVKLGDYSRDFSYILMLVNTKKHKGKPSYEELAELVGLCGLYYQYYTIEENNSCEVVIASEKDGKVLYREVYTD